MLTQKVLLIIIWIFLFACSNSSAPEFDSHIRGIVLNNQSDPVKDALIEINFHTILLPASVEKTATSPITSFRFAIAKAGHIRFGIKKRNSDNLVKLLIDDSLQAGYYTVTWDGKNSDGKYVISDVYRTFREEEGQLKGEKEFVYLRDYSKEDTISTLEYFAITDAKGEFEIPQDNLPFGYQFNATDDSGNFIGRNEITWEIKIWALHNAYQLTVLDNVLIDSENGADIQLKFK